MVLDALNSEFDLPIPGTGTVHWIRLVLGGIGHADSMFLNCITCKSVPGAVYRSPVTARPDSWFCIFPWEKTSMNMSLAHLEVFHGGCTRRLAELISVLDQEFPRNKKKRDEAAVAHRKRCLFRMLRRAGDERTKSWPHS